MGGVRAGIVVLGGVALFNIGNYLFHIISARHLGPRGYGDLATLVAISNLVALPVGGLQVWVARYIAAFEALKQHEASRLLSRTSFIYTTAVAAALTIVLLTLAWPIQQLLAIDSIAAVVLTAICTLPALTAPVLWGLAQGLQRFVLVSVVVGIGPVVRVLLTVIAFAAGLKVGGAMLASLLSLVFALAVPMWLLRGWLQRPRHPGAHSAVVLPRPHSLIPVIGGILAITALTTNDVVVAKAALSAHEAGIYGSASLLGRAILYLPTAIATVLLPRVAARTAENLRTLDLLGKSVVVTAAFSVAGTLIYAGAGSAIVRITFGSDYSEAASLLVLFGVAMSLFSVINVLLIYHVARSHNAFAWLLLAAAGIQLLAFLAFHGSARALLGVDIATAAALLVGHEIVTRATLLRALKEVGRDVIAVASTRRRAHSSPTAG